MARTTPERETWGSLLRSGRDRLDAAGIEDAGLEAELLMRQTLRRPGAPVPTKAWLLPRLGTSLTAEVRDGFEGLLSRRLQREPSAYILSVREFYGLAFEVTPDVLIPRPETELLVGTAQKWASGGSGHWTSFPPPATTAFFLENGRRITDPIRIADIGTGSGAIAVALAKHLPVSTVIATDVSRSALAVAERNASRHGVRERISFRHGDLLEPLHSYVDLIVANLPYVTVSDWQTLEPEVRDHEPALALRGGDDGLELIRALLMQARRYLRPGGAICLEFGIGQAVGLREATAAILPGSRMAMFEDFAGIPRVLIVSV